jgi:hypothetical protein
LRDWKTFSAALRGSLMALLSTEVMPRLAVRRTSPSAQGKGWAAIWACNSSARLRITSGPAG